MYRGHINNKPLDADAEEFTDGFLTDRANTYSIGFGGAVGGATFPDGEKPLNPNAVRGFELGGGTPTLGVTSSVGTPTGNYLPFVGSGGRK